MIKDIEEILPQYATLSHATVQLNDMGEKTIETQIKIDGEIVPDFSQDWELIYKGEKYIMPLRIPQGAKENTSLNSTIDLTFQHWAIYQLKRWTFVTIQQISAGTYLPDEEVATVQLNLKDFCTLFGQVLDYYYGGAITIDFNDDPVTGWKYKTEPTIITIEHSYIWDVLIKFYELFGVRWEIEKAPSRNYLLESDTIKENGDYFIAYYYLAEKPVEGEDMTITIWGKLSENKRQFVAYNSGGIVSLCFLTEISEGVYGGSFKWRNDNGSGYISDSSKIEIYVYDRTQSGISRIEKIKLERGINASPVWSSEYEDLGLNATDDRYVIKVGYPTTEVDHIFEYGFEGGLLKVERQVQSEDIRNMLKGRGGETNIPFRYFKNTDPNNKDFRPDPDWVKELATIHFTNLMPATFRSYVQGWKAAHLTETDSDGNLLYEGYTPVGESNSYAPWAYRKGYTDTKFSPVEFVADEITINPGTGDRQVDILPGYSPYVKKGSSLDKYGPLAGTLDNNDDIYPTIQGTGLDVVVAVEHIESDDVVESAENESQIKNIDGCKTPVNNLEQSEYRAVSLPKTYFTVEPGMTANLEFDVKVLDAYKFIRDGRGGGRTTKVDISKAEVIKPYTVNVFSANTNESISSVGIPEGDYYYEITCTVHNLTSNETFEVVIGDEEPKKELSNLSAQWTNTFDIWVKNIWGTTKLSTETNSQYSERVWKHVLGDREGNEAAVVFTSGELAHEDYEFKIPKGSFPVYDTSKTYTDADGTVHTSHWRIKLAKSDAELEATGLYVPSTQKQGKAGDTFAFIGTEMTHIPYVVDAEERLDNWKKDQLGEKKEIKPTFVVTTDRVRLNGEGKPDALIHQLRVGNSIRLADKRFIAPLDNRAYETLYLQSITYTYREPSNEDSALNPDVEIVLGDKYASTANPVSMMQSDISSLQKQVGSISNVEQIVRAVGDKLYLRKDGISDRSLSPTKFFSLLTSGDFRSGLVGGSGWGLFKDENGNWVMETDRVNVRQEMQVNTIVINQAMARGGMEIDTAAFMTATSVVETNDGYICYFDSKKGSVANLFHVDDVAFCNCWTPENEELKFYKRRVVAVGVDSITLTKALTEDLRPADWPDSGVNGTGIPAEGDIIIHFGSYKDETRRYVKVRDVVGGGYERYIEGLDSVNAEGYEYFFIGKQNGQNPRFFIGDESTQFIEYKDNELFIKAQISAESPFDGKTIGEAINDNYLTKALQNDTTITGGLIQTTTIKYGEKDGDNYIVRAGTNGAVGDKGLRTLALWAGGDSVDAEDEDSSNRASFAVRMDGSMYASNGTVRFDNNSMKLGDFADFNKDKIAIRYKNNDVLTISNESVGSIYDYQVSSVNEFDTHFTEESFIRVLTSGVLAGSYLRIPDFKEYLTGVDNGIYSINISPKVHMVKNKDFLFTATNLGVFKIRFDLINKEESTDKEVLLASSTATFYHKNADHIYSVCDPLSFLGALNRGLIYIVSTEIPGLSPALGNYYKNSTSDFNFSGYVKKQYSDQTTIGRDGISSSFDNSVFLYNGNSFLARIGGYGLKITSNGIKVIKNGVEHDL